MEKQNRIWVVEELSEKGRWMPSDLAATTKENANGTKMLLNMNYPDIRYRVTKYTAPRGYA